MNRNPGNAALEATDLTLLQEIRSGSEQAFTLLAERYAPFLRGLADQWAVPSVDRDDLQQEGLLGLLTATQTYREDGGASFSTYARTCARHRVISAVRRARWREEVSLPEDEDAEGGLSAGQAGPEQTVLEKDEEQRLHQRLRQRLTPKEYEVLCEHLAGYSYKEIASRLHVTCKSVDNALQRIRRKLSA